jgi:hypothetical protein
VALGAAVRAAGVGGEGLPGVGAVYGAKFESRL